MSDAENARFDALVEEIVSLAARERVFPIRASAALASYMIVVYAEFKKDGVPIPDSKQFIEGMYTSLDLMWQRVCGVWGGEAFEGEERVLQ